MSFFEPPKTGTHLNSDCKEVYCKFTKSGNHAEENFVNYCKKLKHVYYLRQFVLERPQLHETIRAGLPENVGVCSDAPIPPRSVVSSDTPTNRKRKEKGYESLATAVTAIADPAYKQQRLEIMVREDARKEKAELRRDAQEVREQERLAMEQQSNGLGEYERLCALIRKNRTDLKESTLDDDERDDLLRSNKLLIKRREKLEEKLF